MKEKKVDCRLFVIHYICFHGQLLHSVKFTVAGLRGSKFFQFHAVFGKIGQNHMLAPPWRVGAPPGGNPGSATGLVLFLS